MSPLRKVRNSAQTFFTPQPPKDSVIWQQRLPSCQYLYLCQMTLFQTFDENVKNKKVAFSSNLSFDTNIGGVSGNEQLVKVSPGGFRGGITFRIGLNNSPQL